MQIDFEALQRARDNCARITTELRETRELRALQPPRLAGWSSDVMDESGDDDAEMDTRRAPNPGADGKSVRPGR